MAQVEELDTSFFKRDLKNTHIHHPKFPPKPETKCVCFLFVFIPFEETGVQLQYVFNKPPSSPTPAQDRSWVRKQVPWFSGALPSRAAFKLKAFLDSPCGWGRGR